jgi:DNA polymerase type B, organellar and viral
LSKYTTEKQRLRMQRYRARLRERGILPARISRKPREPRERKLRPFVGIDGEGGGRNHWGQQYYMLLRAGDRELFLNRPLQMLECFDFLLGLPAEWHLVAFGLGYDATQILRGLIDLSQPGPTLKRLRYLFADHTGIRYLHWDKYGIEYLPNQYLRISRQRRHLVSPAIDPRGYLWKTVPGSVRTIHEVRRNFDGSFLQALKDWDVGREYWPLIARNKGGRDQFSRRMTQEIREYNRVECLLLAELMEKYRAACHAAGLRPNSWSGPGKLAAFKHREQKTIRRTRVERLTPAQVRKMAELAYFGGRAEALWIGGVSGPVYAADQRSAFPAAMRQLPCQRHGVWLRMKRPPRQGLFIARVKFEHPELPFCGLPIRRKDGRLFWPRQGEGIYWSVELKAAERLGAKLKYLEGWRFEAGCDCQPYAWIDELYQRRQALGPVQGIAIRKTLQSLYGKLIQRIGRAPYGNIIHAGLTTALTRAVLIDAARQAPEAIIMFATDAIYSSRALKLDEGPGLGQWSRSQHEKLFIVQPGLSWCPCHALKSRGVPAAEFRTKYVRQFERAWDAWIHLQQLLKVVPPIPKVRMRLRMFVGLKLGTARERLELVGRWMSVGDRAELYDHLPGRKWRGKTFTFLWSAKRAFPGWRLKGRTAITESCAGGPDLVSVPRRELAEDQTRSIEELRWLRDEQPDHLDLAEALELD